MKIAIDISPLKIGHFLQHRVRGTGFYLESLRKSLEKYFPGNSYTYFTRGEKLSKNLDLAHIPYFEPFFFTLSLTSKIKTVVTVHDLTPLVFPKSFPSGIKGKLKWQIQKHGLRKASHVITDSESSKEDIIKYTGIKPERISVIYLAADPVFKQVSHQPSTISHLRKKYFLPERFALYVGDATWNKNLPRLVEAVKKTDIPLVMVGKALMEKDIDETNPWNQGLVMAQRFTENDKQFIKLGFVETKDLVSLYNLAEFFVMPSIYEGFGLPILEAMNCGCPVITTKEGSLLEVAGKSACYVDAYSIDSIAKGMKELWENENIRLALSKNGLENARKFSWKKTAEETIGVYKKVYENKNN